MAIIDNKEELTLTIKQLSKELATHFLYFNLSLQLLYSITPTSVLDRKEEEFLLGIQ